MSAEQYSLQPIRPAAHDRPRAMIPVSATWTLQTLTGETVFEVDDGPIRTGILNAEGWEIVRYPERQPIGFDLTRGAGKS